MAPNHRIYPRLNVEDFETELDKAVIKADWEKLREGPTMKNVTKHLNLVIKRILSKHLIQVRK